MARGLFFMNLAHSSATLSCEPAGLIGMAVVAPVMPSAVAAVCSWVVAVALSELLSCTAPLLM